MEPYETRLRASVNDLIDVIGDLLSLKKEFEARGLSDDTQISSETKNIIAFLGALDTTLVSGGTLPPGGYTVLYTIRP